MYNLFWVKMIKEELWDSDDSEKSIEFSKDYEVMGEITGYDDFGEFMLWIDEDDSDKTT